MTFDLGMHIALLVRQLLAVFRLSRQAEIGPECVKTLMTLSSWSIDLRWLCARTVNAACCIGRDLEHVSAVFTPMGWAKVSLS
jgi:hypothetical protein